METLGTTLKEARLRKKLTASEAARGTRIKIQHIEALEQDDFSSMAAPAYAKGFIRIYADFLGLDPEPMIEEYMENHMPRQRASLLPEDEPSDQGRGGASKRASFQWPSLPSIPWDRVRAGLQSLVARLRNLPRPDWQRWTTALKRDRAKRGLAIGVAVLVVLLGIGFLLNWRGESTSDTAYVLERPLPVLELITAPYVE